MSWMETTTTTRKMCQKCVRFSVCVRARVCFCSTLYQILIICSVFCCCWNLWRWPSHYYYAKYVLWLPGTAHVPRLEVERWIGQTKEFFAFFLMAFYQTARLAQQPKFEILLRACQTLERNSNQPSFVRSIYNGALVFLYYSKLVNQMVSSKFGSLDLVALPTPGINNYNSMLFHFPDTTIWLESTQNETMALFHFWNTLIIQCIDFVY